MNICSICQRKYEGHGNNARPINDGRCCNDCNSLVVAARLNKMYRIEEKNEQDE